MKAKLIVLGSVALLGLTGAAMADDTAVNVDLRGLYMTRSDGSSFPVVSTNANPHTGDIFRSSKFEPGFTGGAKARIAIEEDNTGVEFGGFFLGGAAANSLPYTAPANANVWIETNPETHYGLNKGDTLTGQDHSGIYGGNFYFTWDLDPDWTLYLGARYIHLTERFNLLGATAGVPFENDIWRTNNNLWGGEVGIRTDLFKVLQLDTGAWQLNADVGAGLMDDGAHSSFRNGDVPKNANARGSDWSAIADLGLNLTYPLSDAISLSAGYDLLYLGGVETAVGQVPVTGQFNTAPTTLRRHFESVFYNGFEAGVTVHL